MSKDQKAIGYRLALFLVVLVAMILLAGFAFSTDEPPARIIEGGNSGITETK